MEIVAENWEGNFSVPTASLSIANNVRRLFYLITPEGNTFQSVQDVPYYFSEVSCRQEKLS